MGWQELVLNNNRKFAGMARVLEQAAHRLKNLDMDDTEYVGDKVNALGGAAWRLADMGLELRLIMESMGITDVGGLDRPTGKGATLPRA